MSDKLFFRNALPHDTGLILSFIRSLADYEHLLDKVAINEIILHKWIFEEKKVEVVFAVADDRDVGFALFYTTFSTFAGKPGLFLEDLFVLPEYRGQGYGTAILKRLVQIAVQRDYDRLEWRCLNWNQPSIDFYLSLGAVPISDWTTYRLTDKAMARLMI